MQPKVSVIIPIYNVEKYLDRCMESILNQSLRDIEVIMIDDGSPGRCPNMCDDYVKIDSRVKVIHQANSGAGLARNAGIEIASGEYYAFLDSDDYFDLDMLEQMYLKAKERNLDAVSCGIYNIWRDGSIKHLQVCYPIYTEATINEDCIKEGLKAIEGKRIPLNKEKLEQTQRGAVWRFIFRAAIIQKYHLRFFSERDVVSEDLIMNVQFMTHSRRVGYMPNLFVKHCYNAESLTATRKTILPYRLVTNQFRELWSLAKNNNYPENAFDIISEFYIRGVIRIVHKNIKAKTSFRDKIRIIKEISKDEESWNCIKSTNALSNVSFPKKFVLYSIFLCFGKLSQ